MPLSTKDHLGLALPATAAQLPAEAAAKIFEDKFGDPKPTPAGCARMPAYVQEAARLYIHEAKGYDEIRTILSLDEGQMEKVKYSKRSHKWAQFMGVLSSALRPSMLLSIEPHNLKRIQRERQRRDKLLPGYEAEEERLLGKLKAFEPGSKAYKEVTAALEKIRDTIGKYTNIQNYEEEQSSARRKLVERQIMGAGAKPGMEDGDYRGNDLQLLAL